MIALQDIRIELKALIALATPLVIARLGHTAMSFVDTVMAGQIGADAVAALALGTTMFFFALIPAFGTLYGVEPIVSQAVGADDEPTWRLAIVNGRWVALALSIPVVTVLAVSPWLLERMGQPDALLPMVRSYAWAIAPGVPAALLFALWTNVLSAHGYTRPFMYITIAANGMNLIGNDLLIHGRFGLPEMGVAGIGLSSALASIVELVAVLAFLHVRGELQFIRTPWGPADLPSLRRLLRLGLPVGVQYGLEFTSFGLATFLMGWLGATALAGHQIAINLVSLTFTAALGISGAAAVRVGHAYGRRDVEGMRRAAWTAWGVGVAIGLAAAVVIVLWRDPLARIYVDDVATLQTATGLLLVAAVFQLADMTQCIGFGVLRGMSDTRVPVLFNLAAYWGVGLPIGAYVTFRITQAPESLWWGLTVGLFGVAGMILLRFAANLRRVGAEWAPR